MDYVCDDSLSPVPNRCSNALHRFLLESREHVAHTRTERLAQFESRYCRHLRQQRHSHSKTAPSDAGVIEIEMLESSDDEDVENVMPVNNKIPAVLAVAEQNGVSPEFVTPPTPGPSPHVPAKRAEGVARCLLASFGLAGAPQATEVEEELKEFSEWRERRRVRRKECVRRGGMGVIAQAYAQSAQDERLMRMISLDDNTTEDALGKSLREPLNPLSESSRFIEWIASEVDLHEDLLLECTPMSITAKHSVVNALCETVINRFAVDFIVDCLLQPHLKQEKR